MQWGLRWEERERWQKDLAGFAGALVPFDDVQPDQAGELFGFQDGSEIVDFAAKDFERENRVDPKLRPYLHPLRNASGRVIPIRARPI